MSFSKWGFVYVFSDTSDLANWSLERIVGGVVVPIWDTVVPESEREIYRKAGFGKAANWEGKPALVIIDALWSFIGHHPVDVLEAINEYPTACGKPGLVALDKIAQALNFFRGNGLPVIYVCADGKLRDVYGATVRSRTSVTPETSDAFDIPDQIAPINQEPVVYKTKASAFFRTPLDILLRNLGVKVVLIAGSTTSGCIRASTVDSHSHGFETVLLEDAIWDRSQFSHAVSLFELSMKYASVATVEAACNAISGTASYEKGLKVG